MTLHHKQFNQRWEKNDKNAISVLILITAIHKQTLSKNETKHHQQHSTTDYDYTD